MPEKRELLLSSFDLAGWTTEMVGEYKLFFKVRPKDNPGFEFKVFRWCTGGPSETGEKEPDDVWDSPGVTVQNVFSGIAFFDGLRHVNFGIADMGGYLNYPDVVSVIKMMTRLAELEKEHCWACEQNGGV